MAQDMLDLKCDQSIKVLMPAMLKSKIVQRARETNRKVSDWVRLVLARHFADRERERGPS